MNADRVLSIVLWFWVASLVSVYLWAQSASNSGQPVATWSFTNFGLYGAVVTPADGTALDPPRTIRADAAGTVTATCAGNGLAGTAITLELVAGEFFPCQVVELQATGTDANTFHGFY